MVKQVENNEVEKPETIKTDIPQSTDKKKADKTTIWNFPKQTLEEALEVPKVIDDIYASNPVDAEDLAKAVGYNKSDDWRFRELLRSANMYGLVDGSGAKVTVKITDLGSNIVSPISSSIRQKALMDAFLNVELFKNVFDFYKGKKPPEDEFFINTIVKEFSVPRDRVDIFIKNYKKNLEYLKAFTPHSLSDNTEETKKNDSPEIKDLPIKDSAISPREFLYSCFVLMPFGD